MESLKILKKIKSFDEVISLEELIVLLSFSSKLILDNNGIHKKFFNSDTLFSTPSNSNLNGEFYDNFVHHIYTSEFIDDLAEKINKINSLSPVLEIGAGFGKLSNLLKKKGINIIPIDTNPKHSSVKQIDCNGALFKYKPEIVLSSWLPYIYDNDNEPLDLQVEILLTKSVNHYFEISNSSDSNYFSCDFSGKNLINKLFLRSEQDSKFSVPIDLFSNYFTFTSEYGNAIEEFLENPKSYLTNKKTFHKWSRICD